MSNEARAGVLIFGYTAEARCPDLRKRGSRLRVRPLFQPAIYPPHPMPRLLLLHGYTEDASIFDPLRPLLPAQASLVDVGLEDALRQWPRGRPVHAGTVAGLLAERYAIGPDDVLLGHSMGGWLAAHIKQQTGATAILLSSFTNQRKIVSSFRSLRVLGFLVKTGLLQSAYMRARFKRLYPFDESRAVHAALTDGMVHHRRPYVYQQLQVLFAPAPELTAQPELRLHARRDNIIRPPDEAYVEIPGDHFSHVLYPEPTAAAVRSFLESHWTRRPAPAAARL